MAKYRMVYGGDTQVVRETYDNVDYVQREAGWLVLIRGTEAIIRVQEAHVQSFEELAAWGGQRCTGTAAPLPARPQWR